MRVYDHIVEEGKSTQFECDSTATSPFYYYKYIAVKNITPIISQGNWPWAVYAINSSQSSVTVRPSFLARSEHPLKITNVTVEFNNVLVCCQGDQIGGSTWVENDQNVTSPSVMICYRVNVLCKMIIYTYSYIYVAS